MGKIGVKLSDFAVITSDNPRSEAPMAIIHDILKGIDVPQEEYIVIEDRKKAVAYAMDIAKKNDIIPPIKNIEVIGGSKISSYEDNVNLYIL